MRGSYEQTGLHGGGWRGEDGGGGSVPTQTHHLLGGGRVLPACCPPVFFFFLFFAFVLLASSLSGVSPPTPCPPAAASRTYQTVRPDSSHKRQARVAGPISFSSTPTSMTTGSLTTPTPLACGSPCPPTARRKSTVPRRWRGGQRRGQRPLLGDTKGLDCRGAVSTDRGDGGAAQVYVECSTSVQYYMCSTLCQFVALDTNTSKKKPTYHALVRFLIMIRDYFET